MSASDTALSGRLSAALEAAGDVAYSWDLDGDQLDWFGALAPAVLEFATDLQTGRSFANRIHPDDMLHRQMALAAHFDGAGPLDCEYRLRAADGAFVWVHERGRARPEGKGGARVMPGVIRAVGERNAQRTGLERLGNSDELTG